MSNLRDDLDIESSDIISILEAIEDEYDLEIPDEESEHFKTISDILNYLEMVISTQN
jgi:acyl carrier protein